MMGGRIETAGPMLGSSKIITSGENRFKDCSPSIMLQ